MIFYVLLPCFLLFIVVLQTALLGDIIVGKAGIELALIFVVYAGLRMKPIPGGIVSFILGYLIDCATGTISGIHTFTYVILFFVAKLYFFRVPADRLSGVVLLSFFCIVFDGYCVLILHKVLNGMNVMSNVISYIFPHAVIGAVLSPVFFKLFQKIEVLFDYEQSGPFERA